MKMTKVKGIIMASAITTITVTAGVSHKNPQSIRATEAETPVLTTIYAPEPASTTVVDPVPEPVSKPTPETPAQPVVPAPVQSPDPTPKPPEPKPFTNLTSQSSSQVEIQP